MGIGRSKEARVLRVLDLLTGNTEILLYFILYEKKMVDMYVKF